LAADQQIVALLAVQSVVTSAPVEHLGALTAHEPIRRVPAVQHFDPDQSIAAKAGVLRAR
jgi:hypothetical protein